MKRRKEGNKLFICCTNVNDKQYKEQNTYNKNAKIDKQKQSS